MFKNGGKGDMGEGEGHVKPLSPATTPTPLQHHCYSKFQKPDGLKLDGHTNHHGSPSPPWGLAAPPGVQKTRLCS